ncbi:microviridin/marinostatin family tricyclic proteinase inhibitor [Flavobacterium sp. '19STA2R22 D10 B1']|uniref:microviridin/marinostatin family tricyclic proteinase inhibitor n=1 Tax=Flavobacterium aerium TaxID=3037261 RepID=UPI00278C2E47|nr:microviridin/marinostatin family tricyclic proteinase inhibitor [Flavobacterium sp. '19STA2R22 D10 B1']
MKKDKNLKKPFFANFLENQLTTNSKTEVQGGAPIINVTLKYPSDGEDGPGGTTHPDLDCVLTAKYPSDSDEASSI